MSTLGRWSVVVMSSSASGLDADQAADRGDQLEIGQPHHVDPEPPAFGERLPHLVEARRRHVLDRLVTDDQQPDAGRRGGFVGHQRAGRRADRRAAAGDEPGLGRVHDAELGAKGAVAASKNGRSLESAGGHAVGASSAGEDALGLEHAAFHRPDRHQPAAQQSAGLLGLHRRVAAARDDRRCRASACGRRRRRHRSPAGRPARCRCRPAAHRARHSAP